MAVGYKPEALYIKSGNLKVFLNTILYFSVNISISVSDVMNTYDDLLIQNVSTREWNHVAFSFSYDVPVILAWKNATMVDLVVGQNASRATPYDNSTVDRTVIRVGKEFTGSYDPSDFIIDEIHMLEEAVEDFDVEEIMSMTDKEFAYQDSIFVFIIVQNYVENYIIYSFTYLLRFVTGSRQRHVVDGPL